MAPEMYASGENAASFHRVHGGLTVYQSNGDISPTTGCLRLADHLPRLPRRTVSPNVGRGCGDASQSDRFANCSARPCAWVFTGRLKTSGEYVPRSDREWPFFPESIVTFWKYERAPLRPWTRTLDRSPCRGSCFPIG